MCFCNTDWCNGANGVNMGNYKFKRVLGMSVTKFNARYTHAMPKDLSNGQMPMCPFAHYLKRRACYGAFLKMLAFALLFAKNSMLDCAHAPKNQTGMPTAHAQKTNNAHLKHYRNLMDLLDCSWCPIFPVPLFSQIKAS